MKKLILSAALVVGSLTTFAQTQPETAKPATETAKQESYTEIATTEVPEAIKTSLTKAYPTAKLDKAYVNDEKQYKLEVTVGEKKGSLVADANGNWIQK